MRTAVIDLGSNSTRMLVADVDPSSGLTEVERRSQVTRLARGVDSSARIVDAAIDDVCATVAGYLEIIAAHEPALTVAIATSAVRDAENGDAFLAELRERFALSARVIDGAEEARMTWLGATVGRAGAERRLVFDIGGGSTEVIAGGGDEPDFHASMQLGVVRHSERFISSDPPEAAEMEALADSARAELAAARADAGATPVDAIAVAGTPTSLAAMELGLDPYDRTAVEGHALTLEAAQLQLARLSSVSLAERCELTGLHPDRAPTIIAGVVILIAVMRSFGLEQVTVSEHDILWGAALAAADTIRP